MISPGAGENSRLSTAKERIRVDVGKGEDARRAVRAGEVVADRGAGFASEKFKLLARGGCGRMCACERRVVLETQSIGASYKAGRGGSSLAAPYPTHRLDPKASALPITPHPHTLPRAWGGQVGMARWQCPPCSPVADRTSRGHCCLIYAQHVATCPPISRL